MVPQPRGLRGPGWFRLHGHGASRHVAAAVGAAGSWPFASSAGAYRGWPLPRAPSAQGKSQKRWPIRDKYRLKGQDGYLRIPLKLLAVHRENRSGLFPSPARVIGLLCIILISGFNTKDANHEGVVVQDLPPEQHEAFRQKWGICYKTFREYNIAKVGSVSALRPAFTETITCQFGTLSHSTLVVGLV